MIVFYDAIRSQIVLELPEHTILKYMKNLN